MSGAATAGRVTLAHQVLANALGFLAVKPDDDRFDMALEVIAEVLPAAQGGPMLARSLAEAAQAVLAAGPVRKQDATEWARARGRADRVLAEFYFWRCGLALEALRASQPKGEVA